MGLAHFIRSAGIEKNALGGGGFARVDVSDYAYVSKVFSHLKVFLSIGWLGADR